MIDLSDIIYREVKPVIESWTEKGIYAISFFVYDYGDDENRPTVTVGYNTRTYYDDSYKHPCDAQEAKWNYAYWPQNEEYQFGYDNGAHEIQIWINENGYVNSNNLEEAEYDDQGHYIGKGPLITQKFVEQLILVARRLHDDNVISRKFGHPIPILIHELEYYQAIVEETRAANPQGVADEFIHWIMDM